MAWSLPPLEIERLRENIARAVRRACPRWLADRADDVAQTALLRVMDVLERREGERELSPFYLKKAAYSAVVDEIRRLRRRREVPLDQDPELPLRAPDVDPERWTAGRELGKAIRGCLGELLAARRRAVTLHLLGHSVPEAAELLGGPFKQTENLVYRGMADLRRCLEAQGVRG